MNKLVLFFAIVITLYSLIHIYVFFRGLQALEPKKIWLYIYSCSFILLSSFYISGMLFEKVLPIKAVTFLEFVGGTWLFVVLYLFMIILFFDLIRLGNYFFNYYPVFIINNYSKVKLIIALTSALSVAFIFIRSNSNFNKIVVEKLEINTGKGKDEIHIVMASDVHIGYTINKERLKKYVDIINAQKPDIILFIGDIIDRSVRPLEAAKMDEELRQLEAPLGVYTVLGNHEYIGDNKKSISFLNKSGIKVLKDSSIVIANRLNVIGRDDRTNSKRLKIKELVSGIDNNNINILLDHQPFNLEEAAQAGIDLQLSGHVHNGQMWPANHIVKLMYKLAYGHMKIDNTHYYVSSGLGVWGPHMRLGSQSEIVSIIIK